MNTQDDLQNQGQNLYPAQQTGMVSGDDDSQTSDMTAQDLGGDGYVQPQPVPSQIQGGVTPGGKEFEPIPASNQEVVQMVEYKENVEHHDVSPEVQEYVSKVDKEHAELGEKDEYVHEGKPVIEPPQGFDEPNIILPMTKVGLQVGMRKKVNTSARWLAEWCVRLIKKFRGRVVYSENKE